MYSPCAYSVFSHVGDGKFTIMVPATKHTFDVHKLVCQCGYLETRAHRHEPGNTPEYTAEEIDHFAIDAIQEVFHADEKKLTCRIRGSSIQSCTNLNVADMSTCSIWRVHRLVYDKDTVYRHIQVLILDVLDAPRGSNLYRMFPNLEILDFRLDWAYIAGHIADLRGCSVRRVSGNYTGKVTLQLMRKANYVPPTKEEEEEEQEEATTCVKESPLLVMAVNDVIDITDDEAQQTDASSIICIDDDD
jgi:hypothetical protein